jgi:hypothetical protein
MTLPMGHANGVQLFQGDIAFVLQDEIPKYTLPFIDDIALKSVKTPPQATHFGPYKGSYRPSYYVVGN